MSTGAKGKYQKWLEPDGLLLLSAWARDGLAIEQIAHNMGVADSTLRIWKDKYSAISAALKRNKEIADIEVENALYKRAMGFEYEEIKEEYEFGELSKTTKIIKYIPPDVGAAAFWLKNRKPKQWRDKQDVELSGQIKANNPFDGLTTEELKKLMRDG